MGNAPSASRIAGDPYPHDARDRHSQVQSASSTSAQEVTARSKDNMKLSVGDTVPRENIGPVQSSNSMSDGGSPPPRKRQRRLESEVNVALDEHSKRSRERDYDGYVYDKSPASVINTPVDSGLQQYEDLTPYELRSPHILIPASCLRPQNAMVPHLSDYLSKMQLRPKIKVNKHGYYILFPDSFRGRLNQILLYRVGNGHLLFSKFKLQMEVFPSYMQSCISEMLGPDHDASNIPWDPDEVQSDLPWPLEDNVSAVQKFDQLVLSSTSLDRAQLPSIKGTRRLANQFHRIEDPDGENSVPISSILNNNTAPASVGAQGPVTSTQGDGPSKAATGTNSKTSLRNEEDNASEQAHQAFYLPPTRSRTDDDMISNKSLTPSEASSSAIRQLEKLCHVCKQPESVLNVFERCSSCWRQFHETCRIPKPSSTKGMNAWHCNHCVRRGRHAIFAGPGSSSPISTVLPPILSRNFPSEGVSNHHHASPVPRPGDSNGTNGNGTHLQASGRRDHTNNNPFLNRGFWNNDSNHHDTLNGVGFKRQATTSGPQAQSDPDTRQEQKLVVMGVKKEGTLLPPPSDASRIPPHPRPASPQRTNGLTDTLTTQAGAADWRHPQGDVLERGQYAVDFTTPARAAARASSAGRYFHGATPSIDTVSSLQRSDRHPHSSPAGTPLRTCPTCNTMKFLVSGKDNVCQQCTDTNSANPPRSDKLVSIASGDDLRSRANLPQVDAVTGIRQAKGDAADMSPMNGNLSERPAMNQPRGQVALNGTSPANRWSTHRLPHPGVKEPVARQDANISVTTPAQRIGPESLTTGSVPNDVIMVNAGRKEDRGGHRLTTSDRLSWIDLQSTNDSREQQREPAGSPAQNLSLEMRDAVAQPLRDFQSPIDNNGRRKGSSLASRSHDGGSGRVPSAESPENLTDGIRAMYDLGSEAYATGTSPTEMNLHEAGSAGAEVQKLARASQVSQSLADSMPAAASSIAAVSEAPFVAPIRDELSVDQATPVAASKRIVVGTSGGSVTPADTPTEATARRAQSIPEVEPTTLLELAAWAIANAPNERVSSKDAVERVLSQNFAKYNASRREWQGGVKAKLSGLFQRDAAQEGDNGLAHYTFAPGQRRHFEHLFPMATAAMPRHRFDDAGIDGLPFQKPSDRSVRRLRDESLSNQRISADDGSRRTPTPNFLNSRFKGRMRNRSSRYVNHETMSPGNVSEGLPTGPPVSTQRVEQSDTADHRHSRDKYGFSFDLSDVEEPFNEEPLSNPDFESSHDRRLLDDPRFTHYEHEDLFIARPHLYPKDVAGSKPQHEETKVRLTRAELKRAKKLGTYARPPPLLLDRFKGASQIVRSTSIGHAAQIKEPRELIDLTTTSSSTVPNLVDDDPNWRQVDTIEEVFNMPSFTIPIIDRDGDLAFRDGTAVDGILPRARHTWKVGRLQERRPNHY